MKKPIIALVVVLVLAALGYGGYAYAAEPRVVSTSSEPVSACSDPDGNDIYSAGTTRFTSEGEVWTGPGYKSSAGDHCNYYKGNTYSPKGTLVETTCADRQLITNEISCGFGSVCREGRCMKGNASIPLCKDSDSGVDAETRGEVNLGGVITADECYMSPTTPSEQSTDGTMIDSCSGSTCYTYEYSCSGDARITTFVPSPRGCVNGLKN